MKKAIRPSNKRIAQAQAVLERLEAAYPDPRCELDVPQALKPYELLIAVRLSAQCTDKRVNLVTPALFAAFPTLERFAEADPVDIEPYIRSCGLYHTKAADIAGMCQQLMARFDSRVPDTVEQLTTLPGVGRKTANLIVGDVYGKPAVVTDTHVIRISNRLGLCDRKEPLAVENQLRALLPPEESNNFCHRMVLHGRAVCRAARPRCMECPLYECCDGRE